MLEINRMQETDLDEVAALEKEIFSMPWSKKGFLDTLSMAQVHFLVARKGGELVGYCGIYQAADEGEITNVAVDEKFRKHGIAKQMVEQLIAQAAAEGTKHFVLEVRCSNDAAVHLYRKLHFENQGIRKNFYEKPREDAYIMTLDV